EVAGQRQLPAAADGHAVEGGDDWLGQVPHLGQAGEAAGAVVDLGVVAVEVGGELQVPASGEELVAGAGDDGAAQGRVVLVGDERLAERLAGGTVEGVGLRPVDGELEDGAVAHSLDGIVHADSGKGTVACRGGS